MTVFAPAYHLEINAVICGKCILASRSTTVDRSIDQLTGIVEGYHGP